MSDASNSTNNLNTTSRWLPLPPQGPEHESRDLTPQRENRKDPRQRQQSASISPSSYVQWLDRIRRGDENPGSLPPVSSIVNQPIKRLPQRPEHESRKPPAPRMNNQGQRVKKDKKNPGTSRPMSGPRRPKTYDNIRGNLNRLKRRLKQPDLNSTNPDVHRLLSSYPPELTDKQKARTLMANARIMHEEGKNKKRSPDVKRHEEATQYERTGRSIMDKLKSHPLINDQIQESRTPQSHAVDDDGISQAQAQAQNDVDPVTTMSTQQSQRARKNTGETLLAYEQRQRDKNSRSRQEQQRTLALPGLSNWGATQNTQDPSQAQHTQQKQSRIPQSQSLSQPSYADNSQTQANARPPYKNSKIQTARTREHEAINAKNKRDLEEMNENHIMTSQAQNVVSPLPTTNSSRQPSADFAFASHSPSRGAAQIQQSETPTQVQPQSRKVLTQRQRGQNSGIAQDRNKTIKRRRDDYKAQKEEERRRNELLSRQQKTKQQSPEKTAVQERKESHNAAQHQEHLRKTREIKEERRRRRQTKVAPDVSSKPKAATSPIASAPPPPGSSSKTNAHKHSAPPTQGRSTLSLPWGDVQDPQTNAAIVQSQANDVVAPLPTSTTSSSHAATPPHTNSSRQNIAQTSSAFEERIQQQRIKESQPKSSLPPHTPKNSVWPSQARTTISRRPVTATATAPPTTPHSQAVTIQQPQPRQSPSPQSSSPSTGRQARHEEQVLQQSDLRRKQEYNKIARQAQAQRQTQRQKNVQNLRNRQKIRELEGVSRARDATRSAREKEKEREEDAKYVLRSKPMSSASKRGSDPATRLKRCVLMQLKQYPYLTQENRESIDGYLDAMDRGSRKDFLNDMIKIDIDDLQRVSRENWTPHVY